jgi:hypothetical protein
MGGRINVQTSLCKIFFEVENKKFVKVQEKKLLMWGGSVRALGSGYWWYRLRFFACVRWGLNVTWKDIAGSIVVLERAVWTHG